MVEVGLFGFLRRHRHHLCLYYEKNKGVFTVTKNAFSADSSLFPIIRVKQRRKACINQDCKKKRKRCDIWRCLNAFQEAQNVIGSEINPTVYPVGEIRSKIAENKHFFKICI